MTPVRTILVPGLACDERVFEPQRAGGLQFEVAPLPMPERREPMAAYARRVHDQLHLDGPYILVGVSFGGMLACELAQLTTPKRILLIASCTSPRAIPFRYRISEFMSRFIPDRVIERQIETGTRELVTRFEGITTTQHRLLTEMARDSGVVKLRRTSRMILHWKAPRSCPCPIHAIHGDRDHVIPLRRVHAEQVVPGAGHLINFTHAGEVNSFLSKYFAD